ncbi:putative RNA-directed DNA polymerase from transposon X-element [Trichonephila clavipes]|nr:putative RNA-directed DNA polymerase from transposon X-element [Trichonephila clavipes]
MTQRTAPWENWHLERGFELLRTFGLVRWGLGGSGHVEGYDKAGTAAIIYQQLFSYHRSKYSKYIPVYMDGSKTVGHVGCGVVFNNTILSFSLHNSMSVFSAELTAILVALQHINF